MYPDAMVSYDGRAIGTVMEMLRRIENSIDTLDVKGLLKAKDILDLMNNAEHNGYEAFMDPAFDPGACPTP